MKMIAFIINLTFATFFFTSCTKPPLGNTTRVINVVSAKGGDAAYMDLNFDEVVDSSGNKEKSYRFYTIRDINDVSQVAAVPKNVEAKLLFANEQNPVKISATFYDDNVAFGNTLAERIYANGREFLVTLVDLYSGQRTGIVITE